MSLRKDNNESMLLSLSGEMKKEITEMKEKLSENSALFLQTAVKGITEDDKLCDPDIKICMSAQSNALKIDKKVGKRQLERISKITNDVNDKFQEIIKDVQKYKIPLSTIEKPFSCKVVFRFSFK